MNKGYQALRVSVATALNRQIYRLRLTPADSDDHFSHQHRQLLHLAER